MEPTKKEEHSGRTTFQSKYRKFCENFMLPKPFDLTQVITTAPSAFQVAGHHGFLTNQQSQCLKPMNLKCVRSRREHLFYQMIKYLEHCDKPDDINIQYRDFLLFINPTKKCDCRIDPETFKTINRITPKFFSARLLSLNGVDMDSNPETFKKKRDELYVDKTKCPCYGTDPFARRECAFEFAPGNYMCLENLQAHCKSACVLDVKIGRITYDPMANEQKILEQSTKYPRVRDFGFRILGMKTDIVTRDKSFGKSLETQEQVFEGIESFFGALGSTARKVMVIGKMLDKLEYVLEWFETMNNNQLRFYSSSLLFVYDSGIQKIGQETDREVLDRLGRSVRVSMIDFAHVFHSHEPPEGPSRSGSGSSISTSGDLNKDDNYLYGLRRLVKFFIMMNRQHRVRLQNEPQA